LILASHSEELTVEEKSTILLLMIALEDKTRVIRSTLDRRLRRLAKQHPAIFKKLLPAPKEGFRRKRRK